MRPQSAPHLDVIVVGSGRDAAWAATSAMARGLRTAQVGAQSASDRDTTTGLESFLSRIAAAPPRIGTRATSSWCEIPRPLKLSCRVVARADHGPATAPQADLCDGVRAGQRSIAIHAGPARLLGRSRVLLGGDGTVLGAPAIILATGTIPAGLPGVDVDGTVVGHADDVLNGSEPPHSVLIVGGGETGTTVAGLLATMAIEVTLVTRSERLLMRMDADVSAATAAGLRARGVTIHCGSRLRDVAVADGGVTAGIASRAAGRRVPIRSERLLVATGERPRTADLGLEETRALLDKRGRVQVDSAMLSAEPGLYGVGGVVASPDVDDITWEEINNALEHFMGRAPRPVRTTVSHRSLGGALPAVATGMTEAAAAATGHLVRTGRADLGPDPAAGWVKVVVDAENCRVLGVHAFGQRLDGVKAAALELVAGRDIPDPSPRLSAPQRAGVTGALAAAGDRWMGGGST